MKRVNDATDKSVGNLKHRFQGLDLAPLPAFTSHIHRGYFPYGHDAFNRELETDEKPLEDLVNRIEDDIRDNIEKVEEIEGDNAEVNYTNYFNDELRDELLEKDWMKALCRQLKDTYVNLIGVNGYGNEDIYNCTRGDIELFIWANRYTKGHQHTRHNHKNSIISGTLYVKTHESAPIVFHNPNAKNNFIFENKDKGFSSEWCPQAEYFGNQFAPEQFIYRPRTLEVLMWPSWMEHEVPKGDPKDDYERISISFNLRHSRKIHSEDNHFNYGVLKPSGHFDEEKKVGSKYE